MSPPEPDMRDRNNDELGDPIVAQLKAWIVSNNQNAANMELDTDIVENKFIDSLNFINFLVLVEELRGVEIPYDEVDLSRFRTLRAIKTNFLDAR
jgi:acyl carrier protein